MRRIRVVLLASWMTCLAVMPLTGGCVGTGQSPPSRFYLLNAIDQTNASDDSALALGEVGIGLGPLRFPAYLKRQQIVTRTSPNKLQLAEFDRWAEPLENNFTNVLMENFSLLLNTPKVLEPPWPKNADIEFQVLVGVSRFDAEPDKQAVLIVRWAIVRAKDSRALMIKKSTYSAPLRSGGFEEIVKAMSQTVTEFSREIATAIKDLYRREHRQ